MGIAHQNNNNSIKGKSIGSYFTKTQRNFCMIQQEKYGGEKFLIVAFVHMLTNANALYEEPPKKPNNQ